MALNRAMLGVVIQHKNLRMTDYSQVPDEVNQAFSQDFAYGPGANQAELVYGPDRITIPGGDSVVLDLDSCGLWDNLGNGLIFAKVRALVVINLSATKIVTVGNDAAPLVFLGGAAHTVVLAPGNSLAVTNPSTGWPVVADTGDKLKIANNAGDAADVMVWILGTSA